MTPHRPAAFINALAEEGSRHELIRHLQETWNDYMAAKEALSRRDALLREAVRELRHVGYEKLSIIVRIEAELGDSHE